MPRNALTSCAARVLAIGVGVAGVGAGGAACGAARLCGEWRQGEGSKRLSGRAGVHKQKG